MKKLYRVSARTAYVLMRPVMRLFIRRTLRAYCIILCNEKVLMIKNAFSTQKWVLPGGGVGHNESPLLAVIRELNEEVGITLRPKQLQLVSGGKWFSENLFFQYKIFTAKFADEPSVALPPLEIIEAAWLNAADLSKENCPPEILTALAECRLK